MAVRISRSTRTWRIYTQLQYLVVDEKALDEKNAHLVHFEQSTLLHLLEGTDFPSLNLASQEYFAIPTLAYLSNDVELIDSDLGATLSQDHTLAARV